MTDLTMVSPKPALLGRKKVPADFLGIADWLLQEAPNADCAILSVDQLVYGGIVPSRLHEHTEEECLSRLMTLRQLKQDNPGLKVYAFNLIMRAPAYSSSEEEPDYYAQFGTELCRIGKLRDLESREGLDEILQEELESLQAFVPAEVQTDFLQRRNTNYAVNLKTIELAREGVIDFLIIPLDDNAEYGYTSADQRRLAARIDEWDLSDRVHMYPGADEIGCTLFARLFCEIKSFTPLFRMRYSSTRGPFCIPKYEDRTLGESIKSHLTAAHAVIADSAEPADVYLMVHAPAVSGTDMAETTDAVDRRHRSYASEIHIHEFVEAIRHYVGQGRQIALADVSLSNGGDHSLMRLLSRLDLLKGISAYAAWNTSGNSLGTVIAHAVIEAYYRIHPEQATPSMRERSELYYLYRLLEDWGYQSLVREAVCTEELPALNAEYFRIAHVQPVIEASIARRLEQFSKHYLPGFGRLSVGQVSLPWKRMFEVGFRLTRERDE